MLTSYLVYFNFYAVPSCGKHLCTAYTRHPTKSKRNASESVTGQNVNIIYASYLTYYVWGPWLPKRAQKI